MHYKRINITIPEEDLTDAKAKAEEYSVNLSALIRIAIKRLPKQKKAA